MAIKKYVLDPDQELTNEQILMIREAAKHPVVTDDNPELTDEQLALMTCRTQETKCYSPPYSAGNSESKSSGKRIQWNTKSNCRKYPE